jgi:hypothetical protein
MPEAFPVFEDPYAFTITEDESDPREQRFVTLGRGAAAVCLSPNQMSEKSIVDCFFEMAEQSGGATGYQTLINAALREYLEGKAPRIEDTLRRIIREELKSSAA